jgi:hypothetical protein
MWIVANQLKGILKFPHLMIEIAPEGQFDLDTIGREKAEASQQLKLAIDSGYLRTIRKTLMLDESDINRMIEERIHSIKETLVTEISGMARSGSEAPKA